MAPSMADQLAQLEGMGFSKTQATTAWEAAGGNFDIALELLMEEQPTAKQAAPAKATTAPSGFGSTMKAAVAKAVPTAAAKAVPTATAKAVAPVASAAKVVPSATAKAVPTATAASTNSTATSAMAKAVATVKASTSSAAAASNHGMAATTHSPLGSNISDHNERKASHLPTAGATSSRTGLGSAVFSSQNSDKYRSSPRDNMSTLDAGNIQPALNRTMAQDDPHSKSKDHDRRDTYGMDRHHNNTSRHDADPRRDHRHDSMASVSRNDNRHGTTSGNRHDTTMQQETRKDSRHDNHRDSYDRRPDTRHDSFTNHVYDRRPETRQDSFTGSGHYDRRDSKDRGDQRDSRDKYDSRNDYRDSRERNDVRYDSMRGGGYGGDRDRDDRDRYANEGRNVQQYGTGGLQPRYASHDDFGDDRHHRSDLRQDSLASHARRVLVKIAKGINLRDKGTGILGDKSDPYVKVRIGQKEKRTQTINNNLNPVWNAQFEFDVTPLDDEILFEVWNDNYMTDEPLGVCKVYMDDLEPGTPNSIRRPLNDPVSGDPNDGVLEVQVLIDGHTDAGAMSGLYGSRQRDELRVEPEANQVVQQGRVPIPCFMSNGYDSFVPPSRTYNQPTRGEYNRRLALEKSPAARLGQYDYSQDPRHVPSKPLDKHRWRDDPFYGWRTGEDRDPYSQHDGYRHEDRGQENLTVEQWQKDPFHSWTHKTPAVRPMRDKKDPFAAWLDTTPNVYDAEQQGRMARAALEETRQQTTRRPQLTDDAPNPLERLPSFRAVDRKRFDDYRDYAIKDMDQISRRMGPKAEEHHHDHDDYLGHHTSQRPLPSAPSHEKKWKDDPFYRWLPGHGLEEERAQAMPSSGSRSREGSRGEEGRYHPVTGRLPSFSHVLPAGALPQIVVALRRGLNLHNAVAGSRSGGSYGSQHGQGTASLAGGVFVRVEVGFEGRPATQQFTTKLADTEHTKSHQSSGYFSSGRQDTTAVWNWNQNYNFDFEPGMQLRMEVIHKAGGGMRPIGFYSMELEKVVEYSLARADRGEPNEPYPVTTELKLSVPEGQRERWQQNLREDEYPIIDFTILFEDSSGHRKRERERAMAQYAQHSTQTAAHSYHRSPGDRSVGGLGNTSRTLMSQTSNISNRSVEEGLGVLSVRVIAAYNLVNMDTGLLGDVSDPYVALRLKGQKDSQRKRTNTINNDLNPKWNSSPFLFRIHNPEEQLLLEVYDDDMLTGDDFIGRMYIPLTRIIQKPNHPLRIRDHLQDIKHGELEVEVGFSPG